MTGGRGDRLERWTTIKTIQEAVRCLEPIESYWINSKRLNKSAKIILITPMQRGDFVYIADMKNNAYGSYKEKNGQNLDPVCSSIIELGKYENLEVIDLYNAKRNDTGEYGEVQTIKRSSNR